MSLPPRRFSILLIVLAVCSGPLGQEVAAQGSVTGQLPALPQAFERNQGQAPAGYQFLIRHNSLETLFFAGGVDIFVPQGKSQMARLGIRWLDSSAKATASAEEPLPGRASYFRSSDPSRWLRDIPQYGQLRYRRIYPGIDLVFHGRGDSLEHDFILQPGARPERIRLHLDSPCRLEPSGDLVVSLGEAEVHFVRPFAYQQVRGLKKPVKAEFVLAENGDISFAVGAYDSSEALVIDPLVFSTYLDGTNFDTITATTTDSAGNVYAAGYTLSPDFPITNSGNPLCTPCSDVSQTQQAFVSKLDPTGHTLLYSAFLGGSSGTAAYSIALDLSGNIHLGGTTSSSDFPNVGAVQSPSFRINNALFFVAAIKADGSSLLFSGAIGGGLGSFGSSKVALIAVDSGGNTYLTGVTDDANFQLTPGTIGPTPLGYPYDRAFVLKVDPTGKLIYSTLIPGNVPNDPSNPDGSEFPASGILVDANGQVTLAGSAPPTLPTTAGVVQPTFPNNPNAGGTIAGYILQLNATASALNFATYLPGTDFLDGLAIDPHGNYYVAGMTSETNLPASANAYQKAIIPNDHCTCDAGYVMEVDSQGQSVLGATYLSGSSGARFFGVAVDGNSNVLVGGFAFSSDFPLNNPIVSVYQSSATFADMVIAELTPDLSTLLFGSYLNSTQPGGGSNFMALAIDSGNHPIITGTTSANDFPTTPNSFQPTPPPGKNPQVSYEHTFLAKLDLSIAGAAVCLSPPAIAFGAVTVGSPATMNLNIKNCGNAPLQISSAVSSVPSIVPGTGCTTVDAGSTCMLPLTFTPTSTASVSGTLTLSDNAAIPQQTISLTGIGGLPNVFFPGTFSTSDLVVGTQAEYPIFLANVGNGNWIISQVTATGDFSPDNHCQSPVVPSPPLTLEECAIGVIFAPTQAGIRSGTLTITDNVAGSPHVIQLAGNGLSTYPLPGLTATIAVPMDARTPVLRVQGTNFFPASQVLINGTPRTTLYEYEQSMTAILTAADVAQAGELTVTISNPAPGGGVSSASPATIYAALRNVLMLHHVFDPHSGLLYGTVSTSSTNYADQVVVIDPASAKVVQAWSVGNAPNQIAVSDDGQFLYVGLDGDQKVAQVALPSGTVNFTAGLGNDPTFNKPMIADALRVLPGQPHAWAVTHCIPNVRPCGEGVAVFDDAVQRPTQVLVSQIEPDSLLFVGDNASTLFGTTLMQSPSTFYTFSINSGGITQTQAVTNYSSPSPGGGTLDTDGSSIYVSNGQVINPSSLAITGTIPLQTIDSGMRVDTGVSKVYFAGFTPNSVVLNSNFAIEAFDLSSQQLVGAIAMIEGFSPVVELFRWGSKGVIVGNQSSTFFLQTSLTGPTTPQVAVTGTTSATVTSGQAASYNLNVVPVGGYSGQVTFSCSNLPQFASCVITPPSVKVSNAGTKVSVMISTLQQQGAWLAPRWDYTIAGAGLLLCLMAWWMFMVRTDGRRHRLSVSVTALGILLGAAFLSGCGSGGSAQGPPPAPPPPQSTPPGTYQVNLVSAGTGFSQTTNLTLVVQ